MKITKDAVANAKRQSAARLRESMEGFRLGMLGHSLFILLSVGGGLALYSGLVSVFYGSLYDECLMADPLDDAFRAIPAAGWNVNNQIDDTQIFSLLEYYQLLSDEEQTPAALKAAGSPNNLVYQSLHALKRAEMNRGSSLAWRLARSYSLLNAATKDPAATAPAARSCNDKDECAPYYDARIASAIAQLPSPRGVVGKHLQLGSAQATVAQQVSADGLDSFFDASDPGGGAYGIGRLIPRFLNGIFSGLYRFRLERPGPEASPEEIASAVVGWWSPVYPDADWAKRVQRKRFEKFESVLLAKTRSGAGVRAARVWVNGIIGWERLAVIVLALYFGLLLLQRGWVRRKHEKAKKAISAGLFPLADKGKQWGSLDQRIEDSQNLLNEQEKYSDTVPFRILAAAVDQMKARCTAAGGPSQPAQDYVGIRAAQERQELDSSRTIFDVLLPTFPAIGFIGTVSSLLVAMSQADRIVSTTDAFAKGLAASQVTDILSLCFSTTLLALCAVLLFSPLSVLQQSREHNLVDDIHRLVEVALRPGQ